LALTTLNTGRLTLPAASTGVGKWCVYVARQSALKRKQWGAAIGEHESIALKLGYIASHTFAMDAMTWLTSAMADDHRRDIRLEAAIAKYFCTYHTWKIVDETLQIRGGKGYEKKDSLDARGVDSWPVERVLRDIRINLIIEGTSEIMHLFIAREALDPHLSRMKPLFSSRVSVLGKCKAIGSMIRYYGWWYPKLFLPQAVSVKGMDPHLGRYMGYIQSTSKRLGREVFHQMMRYQKKLEAKQAILNRIVDIGVELFAMAATCSYADALMKSSKEKGNALHLAELFCCSAQQRIEVFFNESEKNCDRQSISVSKKLLAAEFEWMERDIIK